MKKNIPPNLISLLSRKWLLLQVCLLMIGVSVAQAAGVPHPPVVPTSTPQIIPASAKPAASPAVGTATPGLVGVPAKTTAPSAASSFKYVSNTGNCAQATVVLQIVNNSFDP